jgi:hypothetical protein
VVGNSVGWRGEALATKAAAASAFANLDVIALIAGISLYAMAAPILWISFIVSSAHRAAFDLAPIAARPEGRAADLCRPPAEGTAAPAFGRYFLTRDTCRMVAPRRPRKRREPRGREACQNPNRANEEKNQPASREGGAGPAKFSAG